MTTIALPYKMNKNTVKAIQKRIDVYNQNHSFKEFVIGKVKYEISDTNPEVFPYLKVWKNYGHGYVYDWFSGGNIIEGKFEPSYLLKKRES